MAEILRSLRSAVNWAVHHPKQVVGGVVTGFGIAACAPTPMPSGEIQQPATIVTSGEGLPSPDVATATRPPDVSVATATGIISPEASATPIRISGNSIKMSEVQNQMVPGLEGPVLWLDQGFSSFQAAIARKDRMVYEDDVTFAWGYDKNQNLRGAFSHTYTSQVEGESEPTQHLIVSGLDPEGNTAFVHDYDMTKIAKTLGFGSAGEMELQFFPDALVREDGSTIAAVGILGRDGSPAFIPTQQEVTYAVMVGIYDNFSDQQRSRIPQPELRGGEEIVIDSEGRLLVATSLEPLLFRMQFSSDQGTWVETAAFLPVATATVQAAPIEVIPALPPTLIVETPTAAPPTATPTTPDASPTTLPPTATATLAPANTVEAQSTAQAETHPTQAEQLAHIQNNLENFLNPPPENPNYPFVYMTNLNGETAGYGYLSIGDPSRISQLNVDIIYFTQAPRILGVYTNNNRAYGVFGSVDSSGQKFFWLGSFGPTTTENYPNISRIGFMSQNLSSGDVGSVDPYGDLGQSSVGRIVDYLDGSQYPFDVERIMEDKPGETFSLLNHQIQLYFGPGVVIDTSKPVGPWTDAELEVLIEDNTPAVYIQLLETLDPNFRSRLTAGGNLAATGLLAQRDPSISYIGRTPSDLEELIENIEFLQMPYVQNISPPLVTIRP